MSPQPTYPAVTDSYGAIISPQKSTLDNSSHIPMGIGEVHVPYPAATVADVLPAQPPPDTINRLVAPAGFACTIAAGVGDTINAYATEYAAGAPYTIAAGTGKSLIYNAPSTSWQVL